MPKQDPPLTVAAAARELDLSLVTIRNCIGDGRLERAPVEGKITLVTAASVRRLKQQMEAEVAK